MHWEKSATANFGVEAGNSFFYFDLNYYIKNSSDLLMERQMPHETGFKKYTINKGKMLNKGLEMKLDFYLDFFNRQLQWKPSVWFSINKNEVKDIDGMKFYGIVCIMVRKKGMQVFVKPVHRTMPCMDIFLMEYGARKRCMWPVCMERNRVT